MVEQLRWPGPMPEFEEYRMRMNAAKLFAKVAKAAPSIGTVPIR